MGLTLRVIFSLFILVEAPSSRQPVRALPVLSRRIEDDRMSECTQDILNEASFNAQAYGSYDVNDDDTEDLIGQNATPRRDVTSDIARDNGHVRRSSLGSSSVHSESTQGKMSCAECGTVIFTLCIAFIVWG